MVAYHVYILEINEQGGGNGFTHGGIFCVGCLVQDDRLSLVTVSTTYKLDIF